MTITEYLRQFRTYITGNTTDMPAPTPEIIRLITGNLGMHPAVEEEGSGRVCFAGSEELRPDFRITFTQADIQDYIYAVVESTGYSDADIPDLLRPADANAFWERVQTGRELRKNRKPDS